MSRKVRFVIIATLALLLIGVVSVRTYFVNSDVPSVAIEHYQMGEKVDLAGSFLDMQEENTDGYSFVVKSARLMSYNEYVQEYGLDKSHVRQGLDVKSIIDIELEITNTKEEGDEASIPVLLMTLVPERKNVYYIWSDGVWAESIPQMKDQLTFAIRAGTTFTAHIPYSWNEGTTEDGLPMLQTPITDTKFELTISNLPKRKVIDIVLSE